MLKRDYYLRSKDEAVLSKWQGFTGFVLPYKPFSETAELRKTLADLGPKVLIGANGWEDFRKRKDGLGIFGVQESFPGLYEAAIGHENTETIRSLLQPVHPDLPGLSKTILPITQRRTSIRIEEKKRIFEEEMEINRDAVEDKSNYLRRSRPQSVSERHDETESDSVCGVLLEDGISCTTAPVNGRKRCTEHKGQRISQRHIPCEEDTEDICGVILPTMEPCRVKPVSRRKRCEDHKGMRVNAFCFLMTPNQEDSGPGLFCEATTKNGLPCTRNVATGSTRCWQHKEKTLDKRAPENVKPVTVNQVICGIKLHNGSVCEKTPPKGRKRCEVHKGMRITS